VEEHVEDEAKSKAAKIEEVAEQTPDFTTHNNELEIEVQLEDCDPT
jgi:hypothetical protein